MMRLNDGSQRAASPEPQASACAVFRRRGPRDLQRRGFTLVEMVVAVSIMSVLMFGVASAILIASHAMPQANDQNQLIRAGASSADELSEEVRTALWFIEHTATAMTFTVPDRDNDGLPERIRYAWSGTPGDPLTRQYNGGTVVSVATDVHAFDLTYDIRAVVETYPGVPVESAETLLSSHIGVTGNSFSIKSSDWIGQYFSPSSLPAGTISWGVTRVQFEAQSRGKKNGETLVQLRPATGGNLPTGTVLEQRSMPESDLTTGFMWKEFSFANVSGLAAGQGLCLVLEHVRDPHSANVRFDNASGTGYLETGDGGSSWAHYTTRAMNHNVYGTSFAPGPPQTATRRYVTGVHMSLQISDNPALRIVTAAPTYNMPEVLSGMWLAEFDADPTLDHNGDGVGDWITGGSPFNLGQLSGGVWSVDNQLKARPKSNLDELTTVDIRLRDGSDDGDGGGIKLRFDWTGDTHGFIKAEVERTGANQNLTVSTFGDAVLLTHMFPAGEFIDVRILIDPGPDTVHIKLNGQDSGTFAYTRQTLSSSYAIKLYETDHISGVRFDYVHVRVGGTGS